MLPWNVTDSNHGKQSFAGSESNVNICMRSMQVFFLAGWVEVGQCVLNVFISFCFIFVIEKGTSFKNENI